MFSCSVRTHTIKFLESIVITLTKQSQVSLTFSNLYCLILLTIFQLYDYGVAKSDVLFNVWTIQYCTTDSFVLFQLSVYVFIDTLVWLQIWITFYINVLYYWELFGWQPVIFVVNRYSLRWCGLVKLNINTEHCMTWRSIELEWKDVGERCDLIVWELIWKVLVSPKRTDRL